MSLLAKRRSDVSTNRKLVLFCRDDDPIRSFEATFCNRRRRPSSSGWEGWQAEWVNFAG